MSNNVLGNLFQDIADAIRSKKGGTETMKPNEFPANISALEIGGGNNILITSGTVDVTTEEVITVEHGHGRIPDFISIFPNRNLDSDYVLPSGKGEAFGCWGFSNAFLNKYGQPGTCVGSMLNLVALNSGADWRYMSSPAVLGSDWTPGSDFLGAIDNVNTALPFVGAKIGNCNNNTFKYGYAEIYPLKSNTTYTWVAISGLT